MPLTRAERPVDATPPRAAQQQGDELAFARKALEAEARAVELAAQRLDDDFLHAVDLLERTVRRKGVIVVSGMGKSGLIGQKIAATLASLGAPAQSVHPAEAAHGDLGRIRPEDALLALSHSGETPEVVALAQTLAQDGLTVVAITARRDSALGRCAEATLEVGEVAEACPLSLAPTSSTTAALALGDALALTLSRRLGFTADDFAKRHPGGLLGETLRPVVEALRFVVGRNLPVVDERLSVGEALAQADSAGRRPGALIAVDSEGRLSGVFTDGDLRRLVLRDPQALARPLGEVMTRSPRTLPHTARLQDAVALIREQRQDEIPIVDDQSRPVGLLDVQDLIALKIVRE